MRLVLIPMLSLACSEYELAGKEDAASDEHTRTPLDTDTGDSTTEDTADPPTDTGMPPNCDEWEPGTPPPVPVDNTCMAEPTIGSFTPVIEWQWNTNPMYGGYDDIMSAPAIGNLNDDNGDGRVDDDDIPDIVFTNFHEGAYSSNGTLTAISGDGSGTLWSIYDAGGHTIYGSGGVAIGDLEADGAIEVCVAGSSIAVICVNGLDGSLKWAAGSEIHGYGCPAMADLEGDGLAEVIYGRQVFDHTGGLVFQGYEGAGGPHYMSFAIDWDGDPELEVIAGRTVYDTDGTILWSDSDHDRAPAVGDFNLDGRPDIVRVGTGTVIATLNDGTVLWTAALPGGGNGGPPTVADFDGDGAPEVGVADLSTYSVFDTDGTVMWSNTTSDYSSSQTGSSVFDFEGDGAAEVVYADEHTLWIYDGATGAVELEQGGHASGTLMEYPLIADVDNDGSTEIIVASNNYNFSGWNGITVIGDADDSWAPARPVWNQYAYHITNVNNDGTIPRVQTKNWLTWNNFRAGGTELGPSHWQADLRVGPKDVCEVECVDDNVVFYLSTQNYGPLDAVDFDVVLQREGIIDMTTVPILASGQAKMVGPFMLTRDEWEAGTITALVNPDHRVVECREGNNSFGLGPWPCE